MRWTLIGAGNMGTLAAAYLIDAGHEVQVLREHADGPVRRALCFADGRAERELVLPTLARAAIDRPLAHVLVACKTPHTRAAMAGLPLAENAGVLRLQNGIGSLDGSTPAHVTRYEAVTTSAVKGGEGRHEVVAENETWMGGPDTPPSWFADLADHWPALHWTDDIRVRQWRKLVVNAAINPLTALHDVANGALVEDPSLNAELAVLIAEADTLLTRLDAAWPGDSRAEVEAVARATAHNTSSMRADVRRGTRTEIDAINGWLVRQAEAVGLALPAHARIVATIRAREPGRAPIAWRRRSTRRSRPDGCR